MFYHIFSETRDHNDGREPLRYQENHRPRDAGRGTSDSQRQSVEVCPPVGAGQTPFLHTHAITHHHLHRVSSEYKNLTQHLQCLRRVWIVSADFQLVVALFALTLNLTRDCRLYDPSQHFAADLINNVSMGCAFVISSLNIFIVGFDPTANV